MNCSYSLFKASVIFKILIILFLFIFPKYIDIFVIRFKMLHNREIFKFEIDICDIINLFFLSRILYNFFEYVLDIINYQKRRKGISVQVDLIKFIYLFIYKYLQDLLLKHYTFVCRRNHSNTKKIKRVWYIYIFFFCKRWLRCTSY